MNELSVMLIVFAFILGWFAKHLREEYLYRKEVNKLSPDAEIYQFPEEERHYHDE